MKVMTAAGHEMILEMDEEGNVLVGGVKLMMRDKITSNGVIHVIGKRYLDYLSLSSVVNSVEQM